MRYVAVLKQEDEVLRFFNSLSQNEGSDSRWKHLLDEGSVAEARSIKGLVTDGLVPIVYKSGISTSKYKEIANGKRGNDIVATLLLATGYCANRTKKSSNGDIGEFDNVKKLSSMLLRESRRHFALLHQFEEQDNARICLFDTPATLWLSWIELSKSAECLEETARDLQAAIGERPEL